MTTTQIATVTASVVQAPTPIGLQQRGVLVSQGGTTLTPGTTALLYGTSSLTPILATSVNIASLSWAAEVVTVTTTAPHGWTNGDVIPVLISGATPTGYNGKFDGTVTGSDTVTYPLVANPGAATSTGRIALYAITELTQMVTTYFNGVGVPAISVLELGEGEVPAGVAALVSYIASVLNTPSQNYAYEVPREWQGDETYQALCATNSTPESMLYFFTTLADSAAAAAFNGSKSVFAQVESPDVASTEFSMSSPLGTVLSQNPSSNSKVPPLSYAPSYGTTAYPVVGNAATFASLSTANVGWIGTGAQGGLSGNNLYQGKLLSGVPWNFWYSTDWVQLQSAQAIANEVINGSATSLNPLYYDQDGINRLQNRIIQVFSNGVSYGLGQGQVLATQLPIATFLANVNAGVYSNQLVCNAEPFSTYTAENPNDYAAGKYAGLAGLWVPKRGFLNVFFNIQATDLIVV